MEHPHSRLQHLLVKKCIGGIPINEKRKECGKDLIDEKREGKKKGSRREAEKKKKRSGRNRRGRRRRRSRRSEQ